MQINKTTNNKWLDIAILAVILYVAYLAVKTLTKVAQKTGLVAGPEDEARDIAQKASYFNPNFFSSVRDFLKKKLGSNIKLHNALKKYIGNIYSNGKIDKVCEEIYNAKRGIRIGTFGIGGDNEERVLYLFGNLNSKLEAAFVSYRFSYLYKQDLFTYLDSFMKNETISSLRDIINKKPMLPAGLVQEYPEVKKVIGI